MGDWGAGVFENDSACDYRDDFVCQLIIYLQSCLYGMICDAVAYYETWGDNSFITTLYIIWTLINDTIIDAAPPEPYEVKHWEKTYFEFLEKVTISTEIDAKANEFAKKRKVVEALFNNINKFAQDFWLGNSPISQTIDVPEWNIGLYYDNATARFLIEHHVEGLIRQIHSIYPKEKNLDSIRYYIDLQDILAAVAILTTLIKFCGIRSPELDQIRDWRSTYVKWWELEEGVVQPLKYVEKRRPVIHETFDKLIQVSEDYQKRIQQEIAERRKEQKGKD